MKTNEAFSESLRVWISHERILDWLRSRKLDDLLASKYRLPKIRTGSLPKGYLRAKLVDQRRWRIHSPSKVSYKFYLKHFSRRRIQEIFGDGETVIVFLKDRNKKQSHEERDWYEKAFGAKQNMMSVRIIFKPLSRENLKKGKCDIWANIKYKMFAEMEGEFSKEQYKDQLV